LIKKEDAVSHNITRAYVNIHVLTESVVVVLTGT
jgi:hypothetical protein